MRAMAVADELLPGLVDALIRKSVDPICPPNAELLEGGLAAYEAKAAPVGSGERFECICPGRAATAAAAATEQQQGGNEAA